MGTCSPHAQSSDFTATDSEMSDAVGGQGSLLKGVGDFSDFISSVQGQHDMPGWMDRGSAPKKLTKTIPTPVKKEKAVPVNSRFPFSHLLTESHAQQMYPCD
jgi:hypothetical protein